MEESRIEIKRGLSKGAAIKHLTTLYSWSELYKDTHRDDMYERVQDEIFLYKEHYNLDRNDTQKV